MFHQTQRFIQWRILVRYLHQNTTCLYLYSVILIFLGPPPHRKLGFPGDLSGKESACNAGDPGSIPGLGRSAGEG